MKSLSLVLNVVLALAVVALFVLHFTGIGAPGKKPVASALQAGMSDGNSIYFVQIDSVIGNFDMAKDLADQLETKFNSSDATLKAKQSTYEKEVGDYQYKAQRGLITRTEAQGIEQGLYQKQQDLVQLQQQLSAEINEEQVVMNRKVIDAIMAYMKENSTQFNYKYVLGTSFGGNILYANDSLDITKAIIQGLNEKYAADKKDK